jgi:hypothetical protein
MLTATKASCGSTRLFSMQGQLVTDEPSTLSQFRKLGKERRPQKCLHSIAGPSRKAQSFDGDLRMDRVAHAAVRSGNGGESSMTVFVQQSSSVLALND